MFTKTAFSSLSVALLAGILLFTTAGPSFAFLTNRAPTGQATQPYQLYISIIKHNFPPRPSIFGAESMNISDQQDWTKKSQALITWTRAEVFNWKKIEPVRTSPPTYHWEEVDEAGLKMASSLGIHMIAKVVYWPDWAQEYPGYSCGPIAPEAYEAFAQFLKAAAVRYSQAPFEIHAWEIGNEPDAPLYAVPPDNLFGCWGIPSDPGYGGGAYADMLKKATPAIKSADPQAIVTNGGLLLDCDPTNPPPGKDCHMGDFLEGILANGGGDYLDLISYHGYPQYWSGLLGDALDPGWESRGGVVLGKANFIREVMAKYGYHKPIAHTEGGLLCSEKNTAECSPPGEAFYEAQADYVVWLFIRNWANDIYPTIWYSFEDPGWRYAGLLDRSREPRPSYHALQFMAQELYEGRYIGEVTVYEGLIGYEFGVSGKRVWVLWAPDEQPRWVPVPAGTLRVKDKYGTEITAPNGIVQIKSPVYIELRP